VVHRDARDHEAEPDERARDDAVHDAGAAADVTDDAGEHERHDDLRDEGEDHGTDRHVSLAVGARTISFGPTPSRHPLFSQDAIPDRANDPPRDGRSENGNEIDRWHCASPSYPAPYCAVCPRAS